MSFNYLIDSADPLTLEIARVRFELGDTVEGRGPRASGANFSDEELTFALDGQGVLGLANRPYLALAALCEMLARDWSKVASLSIGPRSQQFGAVAEQWSKRAAEIRAQYGGGGTAGIAFSVTPVRNDGYSAYASGDEYGR